MRFRRASGRYAMTPPPETPYARAGQVWDERLGSARAQARNWRLMAFGNFFLSAGLAAGLFWQSMQSRVTPYVVEVDRLGEARAVAPAESDYRPTDGQVAWHLGRFIANVRSISLDPVLVRQNWLSAYDFAGGEAVHFLNEFAKSSAPFASIGRRTVAVEVNSVVRASDRSFQLEWTERLYERGTPAGVTRWTAILTVEVRPPVNADMLRKNPLGLQVIGIDWSKKLDSEERSPLPDSPPLPAAGPGPRPGAAPVSIPSIED